MSDDINDFLMGGGGKAFPFEAVGDSVTGEIIHMDKRQQTHIETGAPLFWDDGNPKMMLVLQLQTDLQDDEDDDGIRNVYLRGGNPTVASGEGTSTLNAVRDAVKAAKAPNGIEIGGVLTLAHTGMGKASSRAMNAPKLYKATYKVPSSAVSLDEMA
jgi:hypothetical protein